MWKNLKENKSFQFVIGLATIWFGWVLYRDGWLHLFATEGSDGYGSAEWAALGATLLASAVSFVQLIGILTIGVLSGLLPHVEEGARWLGRLVKRGSEKAVQAAKDWKNAEKVEGEWNWKPLAAAVLAGLLWTGGHLNTAWDWAWDNIPDIVEVLPRGESNGRLVPDGRDGLTGDLDLTPITDDREEIRVDEDRETPVPDDSGDCDNGSKHRKGVSDGKRKPLGRLRLWRR